MIMIMFSYTWRRRENVIIRENALWIWREAEGRDYSFFDTKSHRLVSLTLTTPTLGLKLSVFLILHVFDLQLTEWLLSSEYQVGARLAELPFIRLGKRHRATLTATLRE